MMNYEEIVELVRDELKSNLWLDVGSQETYTGGDPCYETTYTVRLMLDDDCISEVDLT